jgi:CRISPR-associated endoribonuclease Cas6/Csy4 subtype I-F
MLDDNTLGDQLGLYGPPEDIKKLDLYTICRSLPIQNIAENDIDPTSCEDFYCYGRARRTKTSKSKRIRRLKKAIEKTSDEKQRRMYEETLKNVNKNYVSDVIKKPYIYFYSESTRQRFKIFINRKKVSNHCLKFNSFGFCEKTLGIPF